MELVGQFLINNFFLLCITLGVIFMVVRSYRKGSEIVYIPIIVVSLALIISILYFIEIHTMSNPDLVFLTTACFAIAFMLRPVIVYFFMRLTITNKTVLIITQIMIAINAIVYMFSMFLFAPALSHLVLWYEDSIPHRGPLFFFCHAISAIIMASFVIYSVYSLKGRHKFDMLACLVCIAFIIAAMILESFSIADNLMNTTIAISCLFYVVYLYQQGSVKDALTGLYDRKAYYFDLDKTKDRVTGIIVIDMNSLKSINDNEGHVAGDKALVTIAKVIYDSIDYHNMDAYRMGGDEFIVLSTSKDESALQNVSNKIKEGVSKTPYSVAIGYAERKTKDIHIHDLTLTADEMMYKDKSEYYKQSGKDRRRR